MESLRGQLLIATPVIVDPNFARTVVLVAEHTEEGAMGLVLNRPSDALVSDAVPHLDHLVEESAQVFLGGPVEPSAVVVLAEFEDADEAATIVLGDIGFMRADSDLDALATATRRARVFAGYSGWGQGQLEAELEGESWVIADPEQDDVFRADPDALWADVLRRKGGEYAILAMMPVDPSMN